ncbi:type II toxin-antitoxin system RelE/ParE family toxin [Candidatus Pacearchaeota archaeon]|nr:type II toxin-antitoxin system RelE/ParE family toxin [Candidatus Pacearchaeota archaeon]
MDIAFKDNKLERYANNDSLAKRKLGPRRAGLYKSRLDDIYAAESLEELRHAPGHYHELIGDRKGQWACDLDQPYRLIFEPQEKPISTDEDGKYVWMNIVGVEIIEVTDYH